ncbi:hypothetical protein ACHAWF_016031 [Thalassiosira exigua]
MMASGVARISNVSRGVAVDRSSTEEGLGGASPKSTTSLSVDDMPRAAVESTWMVATPTPAHETLVVEEHLRAKSARDAPVISKLVAWKVSPPNTRLSGLASMLTVATRKRYQSSGYTLTTSFDFPFADAGGPKTIQHKKAKNPAGQGSSRTISSLSFSR